MNKIKAFTLAGLIGLIGFAAGFAGEAAAQSAYDAFKPSDQVGERGIIAIKPGELLPAVMPTDQKAGFVQEAYGDALGRKAGDGSNNALIGLLHPTDQVPAGPTPTDQRGGYVQGAYGELLGRKAGPGTLVLGSLNSLKSTDQLFANSRGGDQGPRHVGGMNVALGDGSVRGSHSGAGGCTVACQNNLNPADGAQAYGTGVYVPGGGKVSMRDSFGAKAGDGP